jgi:thioredoxin 1
MKLNLFVFLMLAISVLSCSKKDISNDQGVLEEVTSLSELQTNVNDGVSLVFFHAPWCSRCAAQRPAVEALTQDTELSTVFFGQVNHDDLPEIGDAYLVSGFPTILIFKDGQVKHFLAGTGHTQAAMKELITNLL